MFLFRRRHLKLQHLELRRNGKVSVIFEGQSKLKKVKLTKERIDNWAQDFAVTIYMGRPYDHRYHNHNQLWMAVKSGLVGCRKRLLGSD